MTETGKGFRIQLPEDVKKIISTLEGSGFEAYAVGGCVRDAVYGRKPHDWDITTSAAPQEVKKLFRRTIDTGIQHGTVTVMLKNTGYEVTTYRVDGEYHDHRRPESVTFTRSLTEDLKRRDFTINAMAYNDTAGLVDLYQGREDLEKGVIRCVGDPEKRFEEDALRIMRAVRFAAELGFTIDLDTAEAARKHAPALQDVSAERIETELTKLLVSEHPEELLTMADLGITAVILPEFDRMLATPQNTPWHIYDVGRHTVAVIRNVKPTKVMRYAALLHDSGKPDCRTTDEKGRDHFKGHAAVSEKIASKVLHRLKMDNDTIYTVRKLVYWHDWGIYGDISLKTFRRGLSKMGPAYWEGFVGLRIGDILGQNPAYHQQESLDNLRHLMEMKQQCDEEKAPMSVKDLAIGGKDLMAAGIAPGPEMGKILHALLEEVLEDPARNEKDTLLRRAGELHDGESEEGSRE